MAPDPSAEELLPHSSQGTSEGIVEMNKNEKKLYALKQAGIVAGKAADPRPDAGDATSVSISADRHTTSTKNNNNRTRIAGHFWVSNARLLCLIMALDLMTMSVQLPSLPRVFESHGMDLPWQGWVASVYGVISFFVAPMLGRASDSVGRVFMLKLSALGSMMGALGSLYATNKWSFIAARTLPGLMKCSLPISQAYIVDVSQGSAERSKNLGMLGASFGMSFVLGPPLGGMAADYDPRWPFVIAVLEGGLLIGALQFLPEPSPKAKNTGGEESPKIDPTSDNNNAVAVPDQSLSDTIKRSRSRLLIAAENGRAKATGKGDGESVAVATPTRAKRSPAAAAATAATAGVGLSGRLALFKGPEGTQMAWGFHDRFFLVVAESMYHTSFAPFLTKVLGFPAGRIGVLLSFMGMVSTFTNAFLVGGLTRTFGETPLMAGSLLVLALGWVMWSTVSGSIFSVLAALTLAGVGGNVFQTVNKAAVAQFAPPELVGTVMGMSGAMETFGRSVGGPLSGYLFNAWGPRWISLTCACAALYVSLALSVRGGAAKVASGDAGEAKGGGRGKTDDLKKH